MNPGYHTEPPNLPKLAAVAPYVRLYLLSWDTINTDALPFKQLPLSKLKSNQSQKHFFISANEKGNVKNRQPIRGDTTKFRVYHTSHQNLDNLYSKLVKI